MSSESLIREFDCCKERKNASHSSSKKKKKNNMVLYSVVGRLMWSLRLDSPRLLLAGDVVPPEVPVP